MPDRIRNKGNYYDKLYSLMNVLRKECPWDREQTISSLRRYTLEEAHEVLEAVDLADSGGDWQPLKAELGDLLLQVAFYSSIAEESGQFNLADVIDGLIDKMIYRHPHVFEQTQADQIDSNLSEQWNRLKDAEHSDRSSLMDGIPPLPALKYAQKQQQRAARVGFDWKHSSDVLVKMREELEEFEYEVCNQSDMHRLEDEFGDILFTLTNLARKMDLDAELCLMRSNRKFASRFRQMEDLAATSEERLNDMDMNSLEILYHQAKDLENKEK